MIVTCNRNDCGHKFIVPDDTPREKFYGQRAARTAMLTCPRCQRPDSQWVYAADIMPHFTGRDVKIRSQQQAWLAEN